MLNANWQYDPSAATSYMAQTDYYAVTKGEWIGKAAEAMGLGEATKEQFEKLANNVNPISGEQITQRMNDGRRVGIDITFNSPKSVGIARELANLTGDSSVEDAHREAVAFTMSEIEKDMQARVRAEGAFDNRTTGNMVAYRVTHRDTRINAEDQRPDMSLHDHVFIMNMTYDEIEGKWKAAELGQIMRDMPYFEAMYHNRLASNLKGLGYSVERHGKFFEIAGVSRELVEKFSRRSAYINKVADELGIKNPESKGKLGATTRLGKAKELIENLRPYYVSRLTDAEKHELSELKNYAGYETTNEASVDYALEHMFERNSMVDKRRVYEAALRYGVGSVTLEGIQDRFVNAGLIDTEHGATTADVIESEASLIAFARSGMGTCRPLGNPTLSMPVKLSQVELRTSSKAGISSPMPDGRAGTIGLGRDNPRHVTHDTATLSAEQQAICEHVWKSQDRVILIRGGAGTGKTHAMKYAVDGIEKRVVVLAPSGNASRGVLRDDGFKGADTVSMFLSKKDFQAEAKNGVIWVDEAGLLSIKQTRQLFDIANRINARVILQGDKRQHGAVERGGVMKLLEETAGLPVAELKDIRRQSGSYKKAVELLSKGEMSKGVDALGDWVKKDGLVDDYLKAREQGKSVLIVTPTHSEAKTITDDIRSRLNLEGEEKTILVPLNWTTAERGDMARYEGHEVIKFNRNSGSFKAGRAIRVSDLRKGDRLGRPENYSVYVEERIKVAAGDVIRMTYKGKDVNGHEFNNGSMYLVKQIKDGQIELTNGWKLKDDFMHFTHGYVSTSHASQGRTVDEVLISMKEESLPAITGEQFYVSVSRGRKRATIYTDMTKEELKEAVSRFDRKKSAIELLTPNRAMTLARRVRAWQQQHERAGYGR